jgi:hypothetical protein
MGGIEFTEEQKAEILEIMSQLKEHQTTAQELAGELKREDDIIQRLKVRLRNLSMPTGNKEL